jgi:hypothetical protein
MTDEEGRERLLAWNLMLLMALEANGLRKQAKRLEAHISAGLDRKPQRRARMLKANAERRRAAAMTAALDAPDPDRAIMRDLRSLGAAVADAARARLEADKAWRRNPATHRAAIGRLKAAMDRARILRRNIQAAWRRQVDAKWIGPALTESTTLAVARGEAVEGRGQRYRNGFATLRPARSRRATMACQCCGLSGPRPSARYPAQG